MPQYLFLLLICDCQQCAQILRLVFPVRLWHISSLVMVGVR